MMRCGPLRSPPRPLRQRDGELYSRDNLFMCNLSPMVDEAVLKQIFSPHGEILSAAVMRNIHTGDSLGTAFVRFATTEQARAALVNCHGRLVCGRVLSVQWAKRQHDGTPVGEARKKIVKLFVRNIPMDVGPEDVQRLFERFGAVESVSLHKDTAAAVPSGDSNRPQRRIAFVTFAESGVADRAAEAVHNTRPFASHGPVPLMVKLAEDHSERRLASAAALAGGGGCAAAANRPPVFSFPQPHFAVQQYPPCEHLARRPIRGAGQRAVGSPVGLRLPCHVAILRREEDPLEAAVGRWTMPEPLSAAARSHRPVVPSSTADSDKFFSISCSGLCAVSRSAESTAAGSKRSTRYTHEPYKTVVCNPVVGPSPPPPMD